eukprot:3336121-Alexandrium_andersonii.AAC.1
MADTVCGSLQQLAVVRGSLQQRATVCGGVQQFAALCDTLASSCVYSSGYLRRFAVLCGAVRQCWPSGVV